jgi:hypothetical protein
MGYQQVSPPPFLLLSQRSMLYGQMLAVMAHLAFLQEIGLLDLEVFLLQPVLLVPVRLAPLAQLKE